MSGQVFTIPVSGSFHIYLEHCYVKDKMAKLRYESRFDIISRPYCQLQIITNCSTILFVDIEHDFATWF